MLRNGALTQLCHTQSGAEPCYYHHRESPTIPSGTSTPLQHSDPDAGNPFYFEAAESYQRFALAAMRGIPQRQILSIRRKHTLP